MTGASSVSQRKEKKRPEPHRCNERVEDVVQAVFEGFRNYKHTLFPAWRIMMQCFKSEVGQEPSDPYLYANPDNPAYARLYAKSKESSNEQWPKGDIDKAEVLDDSKYG